MILEIITKTLILVLKSVESWNSPLTNLYTLNYQPRKLKHVRNNEL